MEHISQSDATIDRAESTVMTSETLSERIASFVVDPAPLCAEATERIRLLLLDYLAITFAGASLPSAEAARRAVGHAPQRSAWTPSRVMGDDSWASEQDAALLNGIASHGLELDDTHEESSLHPGVVVFPAVLAVADRDGHPLDAALDAAAVGYDVMCAVGVLAGAAETYARGFHPTGVAGAVGAAAAVARLLDLDPAATRDAIGLAANITAGGLQFLAEGAWTKRLNAGQAAANGIRAARLAAGGFRAPASALEGVHGYLVQHARGIPDDRVLELERGRGVLSTSVKFYPCCRYIHGAIDLLAEVRRAHPGLRLDEVEDIEVAVIGAGAALVAEPAADKLAIHGPVDAQFSMPFGAAVALATGGATVSQFDRAAETAESLAGWMQRVRCVASPAVDAAYPAQWQAEVAVTLGDGTRITRREDAFRGSPQAGITREDVVDKASGLVGRETLDALLAIAGLS